MATDLETRPTTSKTESSLQRQFADLCARIKRVDLAAHLLSLSLAVFCYALFVGLFDWLAGNSTAASITRWIGFGVFVGLFGLLLVRTMRCAVRRVNPYYVAHQLEATLPNAKNSLINWLDLQDQAIPSAFQKTVSARAAEQFEECDTERPIKNRKNRILLGCLALPTLGLIIVAILNPPAFGPSMLRAFAPFYTPPPIASNRITDVQPGDAEVNPTQPITIIAKIEGRVSHRQGAPTLSYRYQASEDYLTQPLQSDGAGIWSTSLSPAQIRTGFTYKLSAGEAETPEYQVRVRTRTHVAKFTLTYQHPPYRNLPTGPFVFPNDTETKPIIRGPRGSEVEVVIHASRPVKNPSVEIGKAKAEIEKLSEDTFAFRMKLTQSGQFRVLFTSSDGEENGDRDWHTIDVVDDDAPKVTLTTPGKDVQVPENGTLVIEGLVTSGVGLKNLTLHLRDLTTSVPLLPKVYRPDVSFRLDDGAYSGEIAYLDVLDLTQLKTNQDTVIFLAPGTELGYWLEATDCSDYQKPAGNVGKSSLYKIKLTPKAKNDAGQRKAALDQKNKHDEQQDKNLAQQQKAGGRQNQGSGGSQSNTQEQLDAAQKERNEAEKKVKDAIEKDKQDKQSGQSKGAEPPSAEAKPEPSKSAGDPQPKDKGQGGMADDAGNKKEQGDGATGSAKNDGEKSKDDGSKGERKDGPKDTGSSAKGNGPMSKDEPASGTKDAGMNTPMPGEPKEPTPGDAGPMPTAKADKGSKDGQAQANAKGIEQIGPNPPNKDQASQDAPPNGQAKAGNRKEADGDAKQGPPDQANQPGSARGDDANTNTPSPLRLENLANKLDQLANDNDEGKTTAKALAHIAKNSDDPTSREIAEGILKANGRDPKSGEKMKAKNPYGTNGQSSGISDELKTTVANREFAARIGQMQLDDWKNRMTPDLLKKAGMTDADWQRYLKANESYDTLVRKLNAQQLKDARQKAARAAVPGTVRDIDTSATNSDPLDAIRGATPPELREAIQRFSTRKRINEPQE